MFCAAPIRTASISGVVPSLAVMGTKKFGKRVREKKAAPGVCAGEEIRINGMAL